MMEENKYNMNWIEVKESKPKQGEIVLTYCPDNVQIGYIYEGRCYKFYNQGEQDPKYWSDVTHWMPLPNKPQ